MKDFYKNNLKNCKKRIDFFNELLKDEIKQLQYYMERLKEIEINEIVEKYKRQLMKEESNENQ